MKLVVSARAQADLTDILEFIALDKPQAARNWVKSVRNSIFKLTKFPRLGRVVPEYGDESIREIIKGPYRIVYKIERQRAHDRHRYHSSHKEAPVLINHLVQRIFDNILRTRLLQFRNNFAYDAFVHDRFQRYPGVPYQR